MDAAELEELIKSDPEMAVVALNAVTDLLQEQMKKNEDSEYITRMNTLRLGVHPSKALIHMLGAARSAKRLAWMVSFLEERGQITGSHLTALEQVKEALEEALTDINTAVIHTRRDMS
jgi:hypothetical protein